MTHCLIIGGTGMLKEVSRQLAYDFDTVSVVGRNPHRFNALRRETEHLKGNINPIRVDYTDYKKLFEEIALSIERYGNISLVISWIHSTAPEAPFLIAKLINDRKKTFRFFVILGSAYANPAYGSDIEEGSSVNNIEELDFVKYRKVLLGFVIENGGSRWLTDEEISSGVLKAVKEDIERYVIGVVEPWGKKP